MKRWRAGGPCETPDSNGIILARGLRPVRCANTNDITIMLAGIAAAKMA